jgi:hypothetical protein
MLFKNSVRTSKRTPYFTITKINWLTLFKFNSLYTGETTRRYSASPALGRTVSVDFNGSCAPSSQWLQTNSHKWRIAVSPQTTSATDTQYLQPRRSTALEKLLARSAAQEIPRLLWNQKVHYRVHKTLSTEQICFPKFHFNIIPHINLRFPISFFRSGFPTRILHAFLISHNLA